MTSEELIRKGVAAKALLENEDFNIALDTVRLDAFRGWSSSKPEEIQAREQNYYLLQAIERLKDNLQALVSNAQFEVHKANQTEKGEEA
jgi:hypothetical protein